MSWGCGYRPVAELMFSVYNAALGTNSIPTQNKTLYKLHQQSSLSDKPGPDDRHVGRRVKMRGSPRPPVSTPLPVLSSKHSYCANPMTDAAHPNTAAGSGWQGSAVLQGEEVSSRPL